MADDGAGTVDEAKVAEEEPEAGPTQEAAAAVPEDGADGGAAGEEAAADEETKRDEEPAADRQEAARTEDDPAEGGAVGDSEVLSEPRGDASSERAVSVSTLRMIPAVISDSQLMEEDDAAYAALRGKANTPASVYTEMTEGRDTRALSRPSAGARTQEAFYRKAVDLISARCTSSVKMVSTEPLMGVKDPPPGFGAPRVFYIHQRRPRPMTPLKVWRGYHGNVYFEPMKINQASVKEQAMEVTLPPMNRCSQKLQMVIAQTRWNPEHTIRYRQNRHMFTPVAQELPPSERYKNSRPPVLVFDKDSVQRDPTTREMLQTLESTGTLRIPTGSESQSTMESGHQLIQPPSRGRSPAQKLDKSKVCKGSVARKLVMFRNLMIPLMQDQLGKHTPDRSPTESNTDFQTRDSPTKLPYISQKASRNSVLQIK